VSKKTVETTVTRQFACAIKMTQMTARSLVNLLLCRVTARSVQSFKKISSCFYFDAIKAFIFTFAMLFSICSVLALVSGTS
jgi:hypothetical protein